PFEVIAPATVHLVEDVAPRGVESLLMVPVPPVGETEGGHLPDHEARRLGDFDLRETELVEKDREDEHRDEQREQNGALDDRSALFLLTNCALKGPHGGSP